LATAAAVVVVLLAQGSDRRSTPTAASVTPIASGAVQFEPRIALGRWVSEPLPGDGTVISLDLSLDPGASVAVAFGVSGPRVTFSRSAAGAWSDTVLGDTHALPAEAAWLDTAARHLEATLGARGRITVDGRSLTPDAGTPPGGRLSLRALQGSGAAQAVLISAGADRAALLLHRLAELHARLVPGARLVGADRADRLHLGSLWTSGFWPGALWQAAVLQPSGGMFARWALAATVAHFGLERSPTHDQGFMYGQSSLAAWRALCRSRDPAERPAVCPALEHSVLTAADTLVALAETNPGAGTIPTNATSRNGETIIDSMMNLGILTWAARDTHQRVYSRLAAHQAQVIGSLLVRPDGSTYQAVHFDRDTGKIVFIGTHQGLSDTSTWARGEGWGLDGFAQMAVDLHDRSLLTIAQRIAQYVAQHLPDGGVPRWDYDAGPNARLDVSAAAITAAGMFRLALACRRESGVCSDAGQWASLGRTMLDASLAHAASNPPLGFLGSQVLNGRRHGCWCNGNELIFGVSYALEALRLEKTAGASS
jgi:unsaturated chondroitin disaccharide hydrolase